MEEVMEEMKGESGSGRNKEHTKKKQVKEIHAEKLT